MNKSLDERLIPNGEYVDAMNVRLGSTEESEVGSTLILIFFGGKFLEACDVV